MVKRTFWSIKKSNLVLEDSLDVWISTHQQLDSVKASIFIGNSNLFVHSKSDNSESTCVTERFEFVPILAD